MRAIEDCDLTRGRGPLVDAPEEVVRRASNGVGTLNRRNNDALRVHRAEDVRDCAVLAGGIEPLKTDQQGALVLGVEKILQFAQFPVEFLNLLDRRFLLRVLGGVVGIDLVQADFAARLYPGTVRYTSY